MNDTQNIPENGEGTGIPNTEEEIFISEYFDESKSKDVRAFCAEVRIIAKKFYLTDKTLHFLFSFFASKLMKEFIKVSDYLDNSKDKK